MEQMRTHVHIHTQSENRNFENTLCPLAFFQAVLDVVMTSSPAPESCSFTSVLFPSTEAALLGLVALT